MSEDELNDFWDALMNAVGQLFITFEEALAAYREAAAEAPIYKDAPTP